jgi:5-methylcytosine-specific restriction endonuclease McrBC GTP-binding regulatory subunit McrB
MPLSTVMEEGNEVEQLFEEENSLEPISIKQYLDSRLDEIATKMDQLMAKISQTVVTTNSPPPSVSPTTMD